MSVVAVTPPRPGPLPDSPTALPVPGVSRLGREFRHLCAQATQPEEIAAALEASGLNDDIARERYGLPSVFACAEALFTHLPYRERAQDVRAEPGPGWALLPRGVLYALPGAALVVASPLLEPYPGAPGALLTAVVFGWGWGQGMASIGYRKTGRPQQWFLWRAAALSGPVTALAALITGALTQQDLLTSGLVGWVAGTAFSAFSGLLILGRPLQAALGFLPSGALLLGSALQRAVGGVASDPAHSAAEAWAALGCAALLPLLALALPTRAPTGLQIPRPPWPTVLGHATAGWLCALFLTLAFGSALWERLGPAALVPVILSVGVLEVVSVQFQARVRTLARRHGDLRRLAGAAQRVLLGAWTLYLLALAGLYGLYLLTAQVGAGVSGTERVAAGALSATILPLLAYGSALLLGTVVSNVGQPWLVCAAWGLGSLTFLAAQAAHWPGAPLLGGLCIIATLWTAVFRVLLWPSTYR